MKKLKINAIAVLLLALTAALIITSCGGDSTPQPTAAMQPPQAPPTQPPTPTVVADTPTPSPSPSPTTHTPIPRPTSFAPRSPDPTPASSPAPATPNPTPTPSSTPESRPTPSPTPTPAPTPDDAYSALNVITLLPKDGIPAILDPTFIDATEAWEQYLPDEPVLGVSINGEHKAYSVPFLSNREIVNDELGGVAIAATW